MTIVNKENKKQHQTVIDPETNQKRKSTTLKILATILFF